MSAAAVRRPGGTSLGIHVCTHLLLGSLLLSPLRAMNHNLVRDWSDQCSKPQTPFLSFYSPESETLIFEGGDFLRIFCQAGLRAIGAEWSLHHNTV